MKKRKILSLYENYDIGANKFRYLTYYFYVLFTHPLVWFFYIFMIVAIVKFIVLYVIAYNNDLLSNKDFFTIIMDKLSNFAVNTYYFIIYLSYRFSITSSKIFNEYVITHMKDVDTAKMYFLSLTHTLQFYISLAYLVYYYSTIVFIHFIARRDTRGDSTIRGTDIIEKKKVKNVAKFITKEQQHTLIIGTTGAGKTQTLLNIMKNIKDKNENKETVKHIIFDLKGDFLPYFYDENINDVIINPADARSVRWDFLEDVRSYTDIQLLATNFVKSSETARESSDKTSKFFEETAKRFLVDVFTLLVQNGVKDTNVVSKAIIDLLTKGKSEYDFLNKIIENLKRTTSKSAFSDAVATVLNTIEFFDVLSKAKNLKSFSIKDYLHTNKYRHIFIATTFELQQVFTQYYTAFLNMLLLKMQSLRNTQYVKYRIFIDELSVLQRINMLSDTLNFARSRGIALYLATQSLSALRKNYTAEELHSITNATNTLFIFRVNDEYTATSLSHTVGYAEIERRTKNQYTTPGVGAIDGFALNTHVENELAVLPSELQGLKDLEFYVRFFNKKEKKPTWAHAELKKITKFEKKAEFFVENKNLKEFINKESEKVEKERKPRKQNTKDKNDNVDINIEEII